MANPDLENLLDIVYRQYGNFRFGGRYTASSLIAGLRTSSFLNKSGSYVFWVPSRMWLEFEGGVISSL